MSNIIVDTISEETAFARTLESPTQTPTKFARDPISVRVTSSTKIEETETYYMVSIEAPGLRPENFEVETTDQKVTLSGEWLQATENGGDKSKNALGRFRRIFTPSKRINARHVEAQYKDGELKVYVPKSDEPDVFSVRVKNSFSSDNFKRQATIGPLRRAPFANADSSAWAA